jgi:hypothetical protein
MSESIKDLPKHERLKLPRQPMPSQDAEVRAHNFDEVALGYPQETALLEAYNASAPNAWKAARWGSIFRPLSPT